MTRNFKLVVSYDGTRYFGWEHQQETDLTIQGRLETVLTLMEGRKPEDPVTVIGAGRTDAGVHARAMTCAPGYRDDGGRGSALYEPLSARGYQCQ